MGFITNHLWIDPLNHFLTSAIAGSLAYYIGTKIFKQKRTSIALGMCAAIVMHIIADMLWG